MEWETYYDDGTKTWSGPKEQQNYDLNRSIGDIIYENLGKRPHHIGQICDSDGKILTNEEVLKIAIRIALFLKKSGLNHNDFVGICARNSTYMYSLILSCYFNATPFHAVNTKHDESTLMHIFGLTKPKVIFCDGQEYNTIFNATKNFKPQIYTVTNHIKEAAELSVLLKPQKEEESFKPMPLVEGCDQTMAVICSSGTTGLPKAVQISNRNLVFEKYMETIQSSDVAFSLSGPDWLTGIININAAAMHNCVRIISEKPYTPTYFIELIKKYKVSYCLTGPRFVAMLNDCALATPENLSSMRLITLAGDSVSNSLLESARKLFTNAHIAIGYGCTELGGTSINYNTKANNSVGHLCPGYRARIIDDNGQRVGPNICGELLIKNGRVWKGYCANTAETKNMQDNEGWIHTGDVAYFDKQNCLYIIDRKKEVRKCFSIHYWPAEIEAVISELPQVLNVCVVSIYDETKGDAAGAVIVKRANTELTEQQVCDYVAKRLPVDYKQLHSGVLFVQQLPVNPNGKVVKKLVQSLLVEARSKISY